MVIRIGHTAEPDDAFMYWGLATGAVDTHGFEFEPVIEDIQTLNEWAFEGRLEVSAISAAAYPLVQQSYALLPHGAVIGTSSLRRAAQVRRLRPDLRFIDFRGNVETRLRKLEEGLADATLLALAGLERLGLASHVTSVLSTEEMLPAVAQGAIGITSRTDDATTRALLEPLNDARSATAVACERAFLARLDGSCKTPIAGLAEIEDGILRFRGMILTPDGTQWHEVGLTGAAAHARNIGSDAGEELLAQAGPEFLVKLA